jgi:hypothetical protein
MAFGDATRYGALHREIVEHGIANRKKTKKQEEKTIQYQNRLTKKMK